MKIWSDAIKDSSGNTLAGAGSEFTIQGAEYTGTLYVEDEDSFYSVLKQPSSPYLSSYYVEDEDNVGSVRKLGDQYNASTNLYTREDGVYCYETSAVTVTKQGSAYTSNTLYISTGGVYRALGQTLYTAGKSATYYNRSNGATRYETEKVEVPLYTDGGVHTYPLYNKVSKNLYAAGSTVTYPAYKAYTGKLYSAGQKASISPAEVETEDVTVLTV